MDWPCCLMHQTAPSGHFGLDNPNGAFVRVLARRVAINLGPWRKARSNYQVTRTLHSTETPRSSHNELRLSSLRVGLVFASVVTFIITFFIGGGKDTLSMFIVIQVYGGILYCTYSSGLGSYVIASHCSQL